MNKNNLSNLLLNGTHEDITKNLLIEVNKIANYCESVVGEGYFGKVTIPMVGPTLSIKVGDETIILPIVIKESKVKGEIYIDNIGDTLIINADGNMTCEALILFMLSKSWYKEENIHLPFLIGMGRCDLSIKGISHLILEKCGLPNRIPVDRSHFSGSPASLSLDSTVNYSYLTNVGGLIDYIYSNFKIGPKTELTSKLFADAMRESHLELICDFPKGIINSGIEKNVSLVEIIDNICIFYLHTCHFLWKKYGLVLGDQHIENIFIHWINESSMCGKKKLDKLETINYEINKNKYIKVKAHGMIYKIGDIGISIMNVQKDVMIIGNISNPNNLELALKYKTKCYSCWDFIFELLRYCPLEIVYQTIIYSIIEKHNISLKYMAFVGLDNKFKDDFPSELDILNDINYTDLIIDHINDSETEFTNYLP